MTYENNEKTKKINIRPITLIIGIIVIIGIVAITSAAGTFLITSTLMNNNIDNQDSIYRSDITDKDMVKYERVEEVLQEIEKSYIGEIDEKIMIDTAIDGLVFGSGDKYATYFTTQEYSEFVQADTGEYVGIGVLINIDDDGLITVAQVYRNSPAAIAKMQVGDKIIGVDNNNVIGVDYLLVVDMVRGEVGTDVIITINRDGEIIDLDMTREKVVSERAEWHMVEPGVGYIKLYEFSGNCSELFHVALEELTEQGAKGFILDLRGNPGGDKGIVVEIADTLFPKGEIITLIDNKGNKHVDYSDDFFLDMPLVVLINGSSASASELLSGGIQDYGVGTLVGETTYGKGVAQGFYNLSDGGVLRLTTSSYLTAGGRSPQDVGIIPDIVVELDEKVIEDPLLMATEQDNQFVAALDILRQDIKEKS